MSKTKKIQLLFNKYLEEDRTLAFKFIYKEYSSLLYGVVSKMVPTEELANQVIQGTFLKIWDELHTFKAPENKFPFSLIKIAQNVAANTVLQSPKEDIDFNKIVTNKNILDLCLLHGLSPEEIGQKVACSPKEVKERLRIAIQELKKNK